MKRLLTAVAALLLAGAAGRAALTDGLVAHWTFDETSGLVLGDATTNASHGTLYNFPGDNSQWVAGRIGTRAP